MTAMHRHQVRRDRVLSKHLNFFFTTPTRSGMIWLALLLGDGRVCQNWCLGCSFALILQAIGIIDLITVLIFFGIDMLFTTAVKNLTWHVH